MATTYRYPRYDLDSSLEVARKITERGAGATVSSHELAALLHYKSVNNGAYLTRLASARLFGLAEGQGSAIAATQRANGILHPDYPENARRLRLEAFKAVPLFAAFLDAYQGRELPGEPGMLNTLTSRFKVPPKEAKSALARMLISADQAGLFDVAGPTRMIEPSPGAVPAVSEPAESEPSVSPPPITAPLPNVSTRRLSTIIEGVLDLMPSGPPWEVDEYEQWLDFFDQACRVFYRLPRARRMNEE